MKNLLLILTTFLCFANPAAAQGNPNNCKSGNKRIVPNILGLSVDEAKLAVEDCDLVWAFSDKPGTLSYYPIDTMGRQTPAGGERVNQGDAVRGFLSRGLMIPDYSRQHRSVPEADLLDLGLKVVVNTQRHDSPVGTVISHQPQGQMFFNSGTPIVLQVSEGPWLILPDVSGVQYHRANNQLNSLGLVPVHGGGSLESGQRPITICELEVWYPVVDFSVPGPGARIFEGDQVKVHTRKFTDVIFQPQPGQACP